MDIEIHITARDAKKKRDAKRIRREGQIPVVIYSYTKEGVATSESASISKEGFAAILRNVQPGFLPTTTFKLVDAKGKGTRAIVKDIQYHVTNYDVLHLDFQELKDDRPVHVKVPVECLNQVDCIGQKLGGFLRLVSRHMKVRCLPKHLPSHFEIDVKDLNLNQFKKVKDLAVASGVKVLNRPEDTIVTVVKR